MYSTGKIEWATPQWLFDALNAEFGFTVDACATEDNAKCLNWFSNGLQEDWGTEIVFMNPPYGRKIGAWMEKALASARSGATVVCLVPSRTDTKWWHRTAMKGEIRFLKRRLEFDGAINKAPFPCAIIVFRPSGFAITAYG